MHRPSAWIALSALCALAALAAAGPFSHAAPAGGLAQAGPDPATLEIDFEHVLDGLSNPVDVTHAADGSGRLFIVEKPGVVRVLEDGQLLDTPFLDIRDRVNARANEQGLLGIVFHPRYAENGRFYVDYTTSEQGRSGDSVISRFEVTADPNVADPDSEHELLTVEQPAGNHNAGDLAFGPDGYLYIGFGDGGAAGDRFGNGQNLGTLLGSMLRVDVDGGDPYAIPEDNPFVDDPAARDEIWAYGLRNPWRYSFDRATGELYIADVGQNIWEEVNVQPADSTGGENYGWPIREGAHCYRGDDCQTEGLVDPVAEYSHDEGGCSITGGFVYRGAAFPGLQGVYFYSDWCSGITWGLSRDADGEWRSAQLLQVDERIQSYGQDEAGELYIVTRDGDLYRLVDADAGSPTETPVPEITPTEGPTDEPTATRTPTTEPQPTDTPAPPTATPGATDGPEIYLPRVERS